MNGTAGTIPFQLRKIERFSNDSLSCKSGIAVNKNWDCFSFFEIYCSILHRTYHSFNHRIDRFQMTWVWCNFNRDLFSIQRAMNSMGSKMILHIAGALNRFWVYTSFKLRKNPCQRFADGICKNIQSAAMCHTDHSTVASTISKFIKDNIKNGHERFSPFK